MLLLELTEISAFLNQRNLGFSILPWMHFFFEAFLSLTYLLVPAIRIFFKLTFNSFEAKLLALDVFMAGPILLGDRSAYLGRMDHAASIMVDYTVLIAKIGLLQ